MSLSIGTAPQLVLFRCTPDSIWWPALATASKQEMFRNKNFDTLTKVKMLKISLRIEKDESLKDKELTYIHVFNAKYHPENKKVLHIITKEQQKDLVCDFFDESFVLDPEDGPRGKAVKLGLDWGYDSDDDGSTTEECAVSPGGKAFQRIEMISTDSSSSDCSTSAAIAESAVQEEQDDERKMPAVHQRNEEEDQLLCTPNQTRNFMSQPVAVTQAAITSSDDADKMQVTPADAKDIVPSKATGSTSKKKKRSSKKTKFTKKDKSEPWSNALEILINHFGWNVVPGQGGFVPTYYIPGGLEYEENGLEYVKKTWKKNVDYHVTEEAAINAVAETYGWTGPQIDFPGKNSDWQDMYSFLEFVQQLKWQGTTRYLKEFMGFKKSTLTRNVHYFETEDDIKEYAHKTHGWVGPVDKPYSPGKRRTPRRNELDLESMPFTPATLINSPRKDNDETPMKQNEKSTKSAKTTSAKKKNQIRSKTPKRASSNDMIEEVNMREEPQKHDEWVVMFSKLDFLYNFEYYKESGRIKKDLQHKPINELEKNKDYFDTEDDVKDFAHKKYGWVGPADKPYIPLGNGRRSRVKMDTKKKNAESTMKAKSSIKKRPSKNEETLKSNKKNKTKTSSKAKTPLPMTKNINTPLSGDSKSSYAPTGMDSFSLTSDEQEEQWADLKDHIVHHLQIDHKRISGDWGWIRIECKNRNIHELIENEDYFANDDALKTFVHKRHGWLGPKGNRFIPFMIDGGGSRRRRNTSSQPVTTEVKSSRATNKVESSKSSNKKKSKKEKKSSKKSVKVTSAPSPSQPHDEGVIFDTPMEDELSSNDEHKYPSLGDCNRESHWNEVRAVVCGDLGLDHQKINGENGFIKATYQPIKAKDILDLKENIDYFASEDALKQYVHENYGWIGPEHNRYSPPIIEEGRRRRRTAETSKDISTSNVQEERGKSKQKKPAIEKKGSKVNKMEKSGQVQQHDTSGEHKKRKSKDFSAEKSKKQKVSQTKSLKEKLNECINNMGVEESDDYFFEGGETCNIKDRIMAFFEHEHPSFLYVCGRPGTGKTTMVRHCVNQFPEANIKFVKATDFTASSESLYSEISSLISKKRYSGDVDHLEKELGKMRKGHVFLVIDEIDFLWSKSNNNDSVFSTILGWASNPEMRLAVIGVSNSIGDNAAKAVHNLTKTFDEIVFKPFTTDQLQEILYARLGSNKSLVDEKAVTFLSRKVGQNKGDARECLRIMNDVLVATMSKLDEAALTSTEDSIDLVKIPDIMKMLKNSGYNMFEQIQKLPSNTKKVLCIATALSQVSEAWKVISVNTLQEYCAESHDHFEGWSTQQFKDAIEMLEDGGMINKVARETDGDTGGNWYFKLGVQLEDVNAAVEKSLLKEGMYRRMFEYARKTDINNMVKL